ncbi:MAG: hypothetical protein EBR82_67945, partial [Caulobacteraceae bacterium]|nr:hypothetical protein [Caulobacteraceae bacterium]
MSEEWSKLLETLKTVNHDLITANEVLTAELEIATKALEGQIKVSERYQLQLDEATQEVDGKRAEVVRLREALVQNRDTSYQTYVLMINLKMQGLSLPNDDGTCELKRLGNDAKNAYMD